MSPPTRVTFTKRSASSSSQSPSTNASSTPDNNNNTNDTLNAFAHTNGGGLSIGAKAGIVLAALIVTALILMGILFLMRRAKNARKASLVGSGSTSEGSEGRSGSELKEYEGEGGSVSSLAGKNKLETRVGEVQGDT